MCPTCGAVHDGLVSFCPECGTRLRAEAIAQGAMLSSVHSAPAQASSESVQGVVSVRPEVELGQGELACINDDSSIGARLALGQQTDLGRTQGEFRFDDPYLSDRHARFIRGPQGFIVCDLDSTNGVYLRIREALSLSDGDFVLVGQQVLRFRMLPKTDKPLGVATEGGVHVFGSPEQPRVAKLSLYTTEGVYRNVHYLYREQTVLGRDASDIVFADDVFLSRRHAAIRLSQQIATLEDLNSSNGTFVRIRGRQGLRNGDELRIGSQLFRFEWAGA